MDALVVRSPLAAGLLWASIGLWLVSGLRCLRGGSPREVRRDRGTGRWIFAAVAAALFGGIVLAENVPSLTISGEGWATFLVGLVLLWAGALVGEWAGWTLGRFYRPIVAVQPGHEVMSRGPYRLVRHPLYAGAIVAVTGIGLALGNWGSLAVCALLPLPAYVRRILVEEQVLEESLGDAYRAYARGRARLVPGIW